MDLVLRRTETGLEGIGEQAERAYDGWRKYVREMEVGDTVRFSWKRPRSPKFHRWFFVTVSSIFDSQEQFAKLEHLLDWIKVGAGHCVFHPGPDGRMVAIPESISWESMGEDEFRTFVDAAWAFLHSERAGFYLWPLMTSQGRTEMIDRLLEDGRT
jgi:hypothetical protein